LISGSEVEEGYIMEAMEPVEDISLISNVCPASTSTYVSTFAHLIISLNT